MKHFPPLELFGVLLCAHALSPVMGAAIGAAACTRLAHGSGGAHTRVTVVITGAVLAFATVFMPPLWVGGVAIAVPVARRAVRAAATQPLLSPAELA